VDRRPTCRRPRKIQANAPLHLLEFVARYASEPTIHETWAQPASATEVLVYLASWGVVAVAARGVAGLPDLVFLGRRCRILVGTEWLSGECRRANSEVIPYVAEI